MAGWDRRLDEYIRKVDESRVARYRKKESKHQQGFGGYGGRTGSYEADAPGISFPPRSGIDDSGAPEPSHLQEFNCAGNASWLEEREKGGEGQSSGKADRYYLVQC